MTNQPDPTAGHSPLPWSWADCRASAIIQMAPRVSLSEPYEPQQRIEWFTGKLPKHQQIERNANAALIVREVNEAPKLRAEVGRLREALETWRSWCDLMDGVSVTMDAPQGLLFTAAVERSIAALNPQEPADD